MTWNSTSATYVTISPSSSSLFSSTHYDVESTRTRLYTTMLSDPNRNLMNAPDDDYKSGMISDEVIKYIYTINLSIICTAISLFGTVANVINIIVFWRQGFRETVNISLMALSISDFFSVFSLVWVGICYNPLFMYSADVPILSVEIQHKTGAWTHVIFTRVTAFLTVYITLERCLCIAFPLKVKTLLTPKRVAAIIVMICVVVIGSMSPNYANFNFVWKFVPSRNRTMLGIVYKANRYTIQTVTYYLNVLYPVLSLTAVVVCSSILILKLNQRSKWLNTATSTQENMSKSKDRQVVKLIVSVAIIFICSFTPSALFFVFIAVEKELNVGKRYENLFITIYSLVSILEAVNSSVNIFVYYKMSSKYKRHFRKLVYGDQEKIT